MFTAWRAERAWVSHMPVAFAGIVTTALTTILGQARVVTVLGRENLLPGWLAHVHPIRATPVNATIATGICSGQRLHILTAHVHAPSMRSCATIAVQMP